MARLRDLTGQRFGRLVVVERAGANKHRMVQWKCKCDCGNVTTVLTTSLIQGNTKSCGCLRNEKSADRIGKQNYRHGLSHTKLYVSWLNRVRNNCCAEWKDFPVFADWAMRHGYCEGLVLRRFEKNEKHSPYNTYFENRIAFCDTHDSSVTKDLYRTRLRAGWTVMDACNVPKKEYNNYEHLIGQKFGKLTIIKATERKDKFGNRIMECVCDCGNTCLANMNALQKGSKRSCGCLRGR